MLGPGDDGALIQSLPGGLVISTDSYLKEATTRAPGSTLSSSASAASAALSDLAAMEALPRFIPSRR